MAFEYQMAFYLLTGQHVLVAQNIKHLDNFNYPKDEIPLHYEEAILFYRGTTGKSVDLCGRQLNANSVLRFKNFLRISKRYQYDLQTALKVLKKDFGNTYYYCYLLGRARMSK